MNPSPLDALSRFQLTAEELGLNSDSPSLSAWRSISNRTGVSVAELMAANPGMKEPRGKVFVPINSDKVNGLSYTRPETAPIWAGTAGVIVVKALAGDTVQKISARHGANPLEVAKYNGLLTNSILGAGREIKIPSRNASSNIILVPVKMPASAVSCGSKPSIQALKPGMSLSAVSKALGRNIVPQKDRYSIFEGTSSVSVKKIPGTFLLDLGFYKNVLYRVAVYYDDSIRWGGISEFESAVSKSHGLPNSWTRGSKSPDRRLGCDGFELIISEWEPGRYKILLNDSDIWAQMSKDWTAAQEKRRLEQEIKKKAFKP